MEIYAESRRTYGAPRITAMLAREGWSCSRKRVARLMNELGIAGISRRRATGCTRRNPIASLFPDLVKRHFVADRPGQLWVADITQHPTDEGWLYIAGVLDVFSRRVVGWAMGDRATADLVTRALTMAFTTVALRPRDPPLGSRYSIHVLHVWACATRGWHCAIDGYSWRCV